MEKREKIEAIIKLLQAIELYAEESKGLLHGILGEMDAARDFATLHRGKFTLIKGGKDGDDYDIAP